MLLETACCLLLARCVALGYAIDGREAASDYTIKEQHPAPSGWIPVGFPSRDQKLALQIGLEQANFSALESRLWEVSQPLSPKYGQYLSKQEVAALVAPSPATIDAVTTWLQGNGVEPEDYTFSPSNDWIYLTLPVSAVETMLNTTYRAFAQNGTTVVRTVEWSLPSSLIRHITTIQPTTAWPMKPAARAPRRPVSPSEAAPTSPAHLRRLQLPRGNIPLIESVCNFSAVTSKCLRTLYNTVDYVPQAPENNSIGIANFLGQTNNRSDIRTFLLQYRPDAVNAAEDFRQISINGGTLQQSADNKTQLEELIGSEGDLDIEITAGINYPTPITSYSTGGSPPFVSDLATPVDSNEPYLAWVQRLLNQTSVPPVISISYGDDEQTVPYSYAKVVCQSFAQLGLRGITVVASSGDQGVGASGSCVSNLNNRTRMFLPDFPASCPYITTVGATRDLPEVVAVNPSTGFASGSGFSNYFPRPSYQDDAVLPYIAGLNGSFDGLYNKTGRAYPDISAQGYHYLGVWAGKFITADGTSAAAPTVASILSLVNDALIAAGKPTLGFLNPWLYDIGHGAFTDVVDGSAMGCNSTGFRAGVGWDVASGWGTPDFLAIENLVLG